MLAALHALAALSQSKQKLSELLKSYNRYLSSGEINSVVDDAITVMSAIESHFASMSGITIDHLDGLTVESADWWFNVRASNTEPLLRLNVEATTQALMDKIRLQALALIGGK
jgi:phosphomannomutase